MEDWGHDGALYFKVDETTLADYKKQGSKPFVYTAPNGREMSMSCWEVPGSVMENPDEIKLWVEKSYRVSLNAKKKKK